MPSHRAAAAAAAAATTQGQRYDSLRGLAPRATTPNLPPAIRVEKMPEPAPTLAVTLDDLQTGDLRAMSSGAARVTTASMAAQGTKSTEQLKRRPTLTTQTVQIEAAIAPQITVLALPTSAK